MSYVQLNHINDISSIQDVENFHLSLDSNTNTKVVFIEDDRFSLEFNGIAFDVETGEILRRPIHRTSKSDEISGKVNSCVMSKDGLKIAPIWNAEGSEFEMYSYDGKIKIDVLPDEIKNFVNACGSNWTCCFELCSPDFRKIVHYTKDKFELIAVRNNESGLYLQEHKMRSLSKDFNVSMPVSMGEYSDTEISQMIGVKGVTLINTEGELYEFNTIWYDFLTLIHDLMQTKEGLLEILISKKEHVALNTFTHLENFKLLENLADRFEQWMNAIVRECTGIVIDSTGLNRKDFEMMVHSRFKKDKLRKGLIFEIKGKGDVLSHMKEWIKLNPYEAIEMISETEIEEN